MPEQSYSNHTKTVPLFHFVLSLLIVVTFIGSLVNLYESLGDHSRLYSAALITAITVALMIMFWFIRIFPLKAQDRAIRAEENLRHYVLTGKLLDPRLTIRQIIGLRFASDAEFPALAQRAAAENMTPAAIKQAVKSWRADHDRL
ncbi:MAG TPA: DUF6526 family protein [Bryobacteraceae bacterium]|nr:DUF6526 family protein [Bryobacteraceae bacterium]